MAFRDLRFSILSLSVIFLPTVSSAAVSNGFELDGVSVPVSEIRSGGPPRDGIPSIDRLRFTSASDARFLAETERVLGVEIDGIARADPIKILNWHEIVNAVIARQPFGVSGLLYNSDMLLYDRNTESLWSQILARAISGKLQGMRL